MQRDSPFTEIGDGAGDLGDGSGRMGIAADERLAQMSLAQGFSSSAPRFSLPGGSGVILRHLALLEHSMRNGHHQLPRPGGMTRLDPVG